MDAARAPHRELAIGQLWDDAPPVVWQAGRRLTRSGLAREDALEQLAGVWRTCVPDDAGALQTGEVHGEDALSAYTAVLSRLG